MLNSPFVHDQAGRWGKRIAEADGSPSERMTAMFQQATARVPDVMDLSQESGQTQAMYGIDDGMTSVFGSRCLMARRLVERGIRFVEIFSPRVSADRWDQHGNLKQRHINNCRG
jgi:hypothetical protein